MDVVYFGNEWFAENRTSSHHIARRLPAQGRVLYVDSPGMRPPRASGRDLRRLFSKLGQALRLPREVAPNLWHCTVPQLPFPRIPGVPLLNRWFGTWAVRRAMRAVGLQNPVSWFVVPHPGFLAGRLGESLVVYYCIDDYAAHPGVNVAAVEAADAALTRRADIVFVAPPALLEGKRAQNANVEFSPHGVDFDLFSKAADATTPVAAAAAQLPRPVIGFFGLLADWIDIPLLAHLARARPDWTLLLVGHASTDLAPFEGLKNVVRVGPQPYDSLPGWAKAFDVAVMPYRMNRQVQNANPLKLREYLATGKPVVSVPTPEVARFLPHVRLAEGPDAFLQAVEAALADHDPAARQARMDSVRGMSWDARVAEVLAIVARRAGARGTS
jgi:glycosyltransferase involved in cell wall biosynthesis